MSSSTRTMSFQFQHRLLLASFVAVAFVATIHANVARAQLLGSEFNIQQFCEEPLFGQASPFRQTILYLEEAMVLPPDFAKAPAQDADDDVREEWQAAARDALVELDWYQQLEDKLSGSLLPSEQVSVLAIDSDGNARERGTLCWPAYTKAQEAELSDRGLLKSLFGSDPLEDLETQQRVFFASMRKFLIDELVDVRPGSSSDSYVRALIGSETSLRSARGKVTRVVMFGKMLEASDYADIPSFESDSAAREAAEQLVDNLSLSFGGASFYVYGIDPKQSDERVRAFWEAFLNAGQGQLASFGVDLALTAKVPSSLDQFTLEIEIPEQLNVAESNRSRRGKVVALTAADGELVDSAIIVDGYYRSSIRGQMECDGLDDRCSMNCVLLAQAQSAVVFPNRINELSLEGPLSDMKGYIGEPDEGQQVGARAYGEVSAKLDGCR